MTNEEIIDVARELGIDVDSHYAVDCDALVKLAFLARSYQADKDAHAVRDIAEPFGYNVRRVGRELLNESRQLEKMGNKR